MKTGPLFLVGQVHVGPVLQQVLDHPQVTTATGGDEGCVPVVFLLDVQQRRVLLQNAVQLMDVPIIR